MKTNAGPEKESRPSKGPWILVAAVFLFLAALWTAFILFAEEHKPESIPVGRAASGPG